MALYSVNMSKGMMLVEARSPQQAKKYVREEYGRGAEPITVTRDKSDIEWAKSMGARIHTA